MHIQIVSDEILFERLTEISVSHTKKLGYWFSRQPFDVKMNVFTRQRNYFFKLKNSDEIIKDNLISLISFFQVVDELYKIEKNINLKNKTMKLEKIITQDYKEARRRVLRDKIVDKWSKIKEWHSMGKGSRKIAKLIKSKYRLDVSHTYVIDIWKEQEGVKF